MTINVAELAARLSQLEDERDVRDTTARMMFAIDTRDWTALADVFTKTIRIDFSEVFDQPAGEVKADEVIGTWQSGLSHLDSTQHLLANHRVRVDGDHAVATVYGHATHCLATGLADPLWVLAGWYEFEMARMENEWRITAVTFHPLWGRGNRSLMASADTAQETTSR